jgi:DNA-binding NtrC family response regulator
MNRVPKIFALKAGKVSRPAVHVIEPDEEELIFLCDFLSISGLLVTGSSDPARGLEYVERAHPEVLICGLSQPAMNGEEILDRTRKASPRTRVILTSDQPGPALVEPVLMGSGAALLQGPFNAVSLLRTVERLLGDESNDQMEKRSW